MAKINENLLPYVFLDTNLKGVTAGSHNHLASNVLMILSVNCQDNNYNFVQGAPNGTQVYINPNNNEVLIYCANNITSDTWIRIYLLKRP